MKIEVGQRRIGLVAGVLCGVAGLAFAGSVATNADWNQGAAVDFSATVSAVREVPAGQPLAGLHVETKVKGRAVDVFVAPMDFVKKYKIKLSKGDEVRIIGLVDQSPTADKVLAREVTTGEYDRKFGTFVPTMTLYLRNDGGPLWDEPPAKIEPIGDLPTK